MQLFIKIIHQQSLYIASKLYFTVQYIISYPAMNILNLFMKFLNYHDIELVKKAPYSLSKPMPVSLNATKLHQQALPYPTN